MQRPTGRTDTPGATADGALRSPGEGTNQSGDERPIRIMVVDHHQSAAAALKELLASERREVAVAHSGAAALLLAKDFSPDVVLCELELPGPVNGYDVARAIRDDRTRGTCCLAALTVFSAEECGASPIEAGFDEIVTKPIDLRRIEALIEDQRDPGREAASRVPPESLARRWVRTLRRPGTYSTLV